MIFIGEFHNRAIFYNAIMDVTTHVDGIQCSIPCQSVNLVPQGEIIDRGAWFGRRAEIGNDMLIILCLSMTD